MQWIFSNRKLAAPAVLAAVLSFTAMSAQAAEAYRDTAENGKIPVTIDNFVRAATELEFSKYVELAGGVNRFFHFREPTPIEKQPTVRMNRDTLYSTAVIDISQGATLTLPDVGERYMTAMVINQDHYINEVFSGGGPYTLDMETFDTPHVIVFMRVLVDAADPDDVAAVNAIQDQMTVDAGSVTPFTVPNYDEKSFEALLKATIQIGRFVPDSFHVFGAKKDVAPLRHFIGTAIGWGGLPESEAFYLNVEPGLPVGAYKLEIPAEVPVDAFWSITVYNADGYLEANELGLNSYNNFTAKPNDDGSQTIRFGGCEDGRVNCIPITEGWNYAIRLYQPHESILNGEWEFPAIEPTN